MSIGKNVKLSLNFCYGQIFHRPEKQTNLRKVVKLTTAEITKASIWLWPELFSLFLFSLFKT